MKYLYWLVDTYPSEKYESQMELLFPTEWKNHPAMFQSPPTSYGDMEARTTVLTLAFLSPPISDVGSSKSHHSDVAGFVLMFVETCGNYNHQKYGDVIDKWELVII